MGGALVQRDDLFQQRDSGGVIDLLAVQHRQVIQHDAERQKQKIEQEPNDSARKGNLPHGQDVKCLPAAAAHDPGHEQAAQRDRDELDARSTEGLRPGIAQQAQPQPLKDPGLIGETRHGHHDLRRYYPQIAEISQIWSAANL